MSVMKNIVPKKLFKMLDKLKNIADNRMLLLSKNPNYLNKHTDIETIKEWTRGYRQALNDISDMIHYSKYPLCLKLLIKDLEIIDRKED